MLEFIKRARFESLQRKLDKRKVNVILGVRRCGKTSLIEKFLESYEREYLYLNGDDIQVQELLSSQSISKFKNVFKGYDLLVVDEAQQIPSIGINLKIIIDNIKGLTVLVTGSSLFDLEQKLGEPLTGRKKTFKIFTIAQLELSKHESPLETKANLENRLIYGSYPEVITAENNQERELYLREVVNSYLLKDILVFDGIKNSHKIYKILQLLAFQLGKEVSYDELATQVSMSKNTVEKYLDILEKNFILYKVTSFSNNPRKELSKKKKFYFHDNGIRNMIINNFNPLSLRADQGDLWENYIFYERIKYLEYSENFPNIYFWRTYEQQGIDMVEEKNQALKAFEIKYQEKKNYKFPKFWLDNYPQAENRVISQENYLEFISPF